MMYRLEFHPKAVLEFMALDKATRTQLERKLQQRLVQPKIPSAQLSGDLASCYKIKLRQQGVRLIYRVIDDQLLVLVLAIGKREDGQAYQDAAKRV